MLVMCFFLQEMEVKSLTLKLIARSILFSWVGRVTVRVHCGDFASRGQSVSCKGLVVARLIDTRVQLVNEETFLVNWTLYTSNLV